MKRILAMPHDRPLGLTLAGALMVLAAISYGLGVIVGLASGGFYPAILGGTTRIPGLTLTAGYLPLVVIALLLARAILYERNLRLVWAGFAAWFAVAALDIVVLAGLAMAGAIAISGLVPLVLVILERQRFKISQPVPARPPE